MSFLKLILKNPFRNRSRAILSILGIGIGIVTIVALGAMMNGLVSSADDTLHAGGNDFIVMHEDEAGSISNNWTSKIANISGVNRTTEIFNGPMYSVKGEYVFFSGIKPNEISHMGIKIINGTNFHNNKQELILGNIAADKLNKTVNDNISINGTNWKINGIY